MTENAEDPRRGRSDRGRLARGERRHPRSTSRGNPGNPRRADRPAVGSHQRNLGDSSATANSAVAPGGRPISEIRLRRSSGLFGGRQARDDVEAPSEDRAQPDAGAVPDQMELAVELPDGRAELRQDPLQAREGNRSGQGWTAREMSDFTDHRRIRTVNNPMTS
jgi:hypothetical protein